MSLDTVSLAASLMPRSYSELGGGDDRFHEQLDAGGLGVLAGAASHAIAGGGVDLALGVGMAWEE